MIKDFVFSFSRFGFWFYKLSGVGSNRILLVIKTGHVRQRLQLQTCARPLQSTNQPAEPSPPVPVSFDANADTLPFDLSPVAKAWKEGGGPSEAAPCLEGGSEAAPGKLHRSHPAAVVESQPSASSDPPLEDCPSQPLSNSNNQEDASAQVLGTDTKQPTASEPAEPQSLFHATQQVSRQEQMAQRDQMQKEQEEKKRKAAEAKSKCKAKAKGRGKGKANSKTKAKGKAKPKRKAAKRARKAHEDEDDEEPEVNPNTDPATETRPSDVGDSGDEGDGVKGKGSKKEQAMAKRKAKAEEKRKAKEEAKQLKAEEKRKAKEEAKQLKAEEKRKEKELKAEEKRKAKEGAKKDDGNAKRQKASHDNPANPPGEKATFARRARPKTAGCGKRWDSLKCTFNTRLAHLFAHPSAMEVWGDDKKQQQVIAGWNSTFF